MMKSRFNRTRKPAPLVEPDKMLLPHQIVPAQSVDVMVRPTQSEPQFDPRQDPVVRRGMAIWWVGLAGMVVLMLLGGWLWWNNLTRPNTAPVQADGLPPVLGEPALTDQQKADFGRLYDQALTDFKGGKLTEASVNMKQVIAVDPNFRQDSLAWQFIFYRGLALSQMLNAQGGSAALDTLNQAIGLFQRSPEVLKAQFGLRANLLPPNFKNLEAVTADLLKQRDLYQLYLVGDTAQAGQGRTPTWFNQALDPWQKLYAARPDFLKESEPRWIASRLMEAYSAQAAYQCGVSHDYNAARSALAQARGITVDNGMTGWRTRLDTQLADYNRSGCAG